MQVRVLSRSDQKFYFFFLISIYNILLAESLKRNGDPRYKTPSNTYLAGFCLLIMIGLFLSSRTRLLGVAGDFEGILSVAPPLLVEVAGLEVLVPRGGSEGLRGLICQGLFRNKFFIHKIQSSGHERKAKERGSSGQKQAFCGRIRRGHFFKRSLWPYQLHKSKNGGPI